MAPYVLKDCKTFFGSYDISGHTNEAMLAHKAAELNATNYGSGGAVERKAGLTDLEFAMKGFVSVSEESDDIDKLAFDNVGVTDGLFTVGPVAGADGERGFAFRSVQLDYNQGESVGDLQKFDASVKGRTDQFAGTIMHDTDAAETVTDEGTARQLGAVGATQSLYAALHVVEFTGITSLDVLVASDSVEAFSGTPEDRITFTQATAITSQWGTPDAGVHADTWYRVEFTIVGTGTATFIVTVGVK
jgi:hypothetical protein